LLGCRCSNIFRFEQNRLTFWDTLRLGEQPTAHERNFCGPQGDRTMLEKSIVPALKFVITVIVRLPLMLLYHLWLSLGGLTNVSSPPKSLPIPSLDVHPTPYL